MMKKLILLCMIIIGLVGCKKATTDEEKLRNNLLPFLFTEVNTDPNSKLFYYQPGMTGVTPSESQFVVANTENKTVKPKLVLVHGWNYSEKSSDATTTDSQKIKNILNTWQNAIVFYDVNVASVKDKFDLYLYTYRTSDRILFNGERFIQTLNSAFSKEDKVIIIAHSMGGLVTRQAVYSDNNTNDVIDYVISLATPYYGSPFSAKAYQNTLDITLTSLVRFITDSDGGKDLSYTNLGSGQIFIDGATNSFLDSLNSKTDKDSKFYPYAGNLNTNCDSGSTELYKLSCRILRDGSPSLTQADSIVTVNSARMANKAVNFSDDMIKVGFDHSMMAFDIPGNIELAKQFFTEVITKAGSL
jgi:hypothetical protein